MNNCVDTQGTLPSFKEAYKHNLCILITPKEDEAKDCPEPEPKTGEWWLQQIIKLMDKDAIFNFSIPKKYRRPTDKGGVNDLRVEGNFVSFLNRSYSTDPKRILATRAIVGDTGISILEGLIPPKYSELFQKATGISTDELLNEIFMEGAVGCSHNDLFGYSHSDGVVPTYSATGERIPEFGGGFNPIIVQDSPHLGMGTDTNMIQQTINNLNSPLSNFVKH